MKRHIALLFIVGILLLTACQSRAVTHAQPDIPQTEDERHTEDMAEGGGLSEEADSREIFDRITYRKDMGGYSINVDLPVYKYDEYEGFAADVNERNVFVADEEGSIINSITLSNPYFAGPDGEILPSLDISFEVLSLDSGNLLAVRLPFAKENTYALSLYYFDSSFVNYIGKLPNGGDFFPLMIGDISAAGDTFTINEVDPMDGSVSAVTYAVDFANILLTQISEETPVTAPTAMICNNFK